MRTSPQQDTDEDDDKENYPQKRAKLAGESFLTATELDPSSTRTVTGDNIIRPLRQPQAYSDELNSIASSVLTLQKPEDEKQRDNA